MAGGADADGAVAGMADAPAGMAADGVGMAAAGTVTIDSEKLGGFDLKKARQPFGFSNWVVYLISSQLIPAAFSIAMRTSSPDRGAVLQVRLGHVLYLRTVDIDQLLGLRLQISPKDLGDLALTMHAINRRGSHVSSLPGSLA
jgi:hypothetical protein